MLRAPKLRSIHHILVLLVLAWTATFGLHERIMPWNAARNCLWPQPEPIAALQGPEAASFPQTNVLLIADPQLIDNHTYPDRNGLLLLLLKHTVDVYLRKNYRALMSQLRPDFVFFLGDYLDNGRSSSDSYFSHELSRFDSIFRKPVEKSYVDGLNWFANVPGNHDVGFGDSVKIPSRDRFIHHFGDPNAVVHVHGVDFVSIDAPLLSSQLLEISGPARAFVDSQGETAKTSPRVLLSHIPLWRDVETHKCGPLRENPVFHLGGGYQYQLALDEDVSRDLLAKVKPDLIFAGDDHDYCDITHDIAPNPREITVKSVSLAMGVKYPAVQLLTFNNRDSGLETGPFEYSTQICYLPTPYINVFHYVAMAVFSGLLLLWWNIKQRLSRYNYLVLPSSKYTYTAQLADYTSSTSNATKISKFLQEQDAGTLLPVMLLPKYTFTAQKEPSRGMKAMRFVRVQIDNFAKKWNLWGFARHTLVLGVVVVVIYYLGFALTA